MAKKKFAVLPIDVFDRLTDMYEELEAIKAYDKSKNKIIGRLAFPSHLTNWRIPLVGISYFLSKSNQGKGFITEAVNALTRFAFDVIKVKKVEIKCDSDNLKSIAIPERLGYMLEAKQIGCFPRTDTDTLVETLTFACFDKSKLPNLSVTW